MPCAVLAVVVLTSKCWPSGDHASKATLEISVVAGGNAALASASGDRIWRAGGEPEVVADGSGVVLDGVFPGVKPGVGDADDVGGTVAAGAAHAIATTTSKQRETRT